MRPFKNTIKTYNIPATPSISTPILINTTSDNDASIRVWNSGASTVYATFQSTSVLATSRCVVPAPGVPSDVIGIPPGVIEILSVPLNSYVAVKTSAGYSTLELTSGRGL